MFDDRDSKRKADQAIRTIARTFGVVGDEAIAQRYVDKAVESVAFDQEVRRVLNSRGSSVLRHSL